MAVFASASLVDVIPHYSKHGYGHGISSRYFRKAQGHGYGLGYASYDLAGEYGIGYGLDGAYGAGYGLGYAGLGYWKYYFRTTWEYVNVNKTCVFEIVWKI